MRYGPPQALLNVSPTLAQNHLHFSSEVWITPQNKLKILLQQTGHREVLFLHPGLPASLKTLDTISSSASSCWFLSLCCSFMRKICLLCNTITSCQTWQPFRVGPCLIYKSWDFGDAGCYSWFRAFHLHLRLQWCSVSSSVYVFHSMSHSTCMRLQLLGGLESSNYIHLGLRLTDWILFYFTPYFHNVALARILTPIQIQRSPLTTSNM